MRRFAATLCLPLGLALLAPNTASALERMDAAPRATRSKSDHNRKRASALERVEAKTRVRVSTPATADRIRGERSLRLQHHRAKLAVDTTLASGLRKWVSADPLFVAVPDASLKRTLEANPYQYVANSPVSFSDPTGLVGGGSESSDDRTLGLGPHALSGGDRQEALAAADDAQVSLYAGMAAGGVEMAVDTLVMVDGALNDTGTSNNPPANIQIPVPSKDVYEFGKSVTKLAALAAGVVSIAKSVTGAFKRFFSRADDAASALPKATTPYKRPNGATTPEQRASVQGKPCVDCGAVTPKQVADHKTPLVQEHYETGTIDTSRMRSVEAVQPQCPTCSARQGAEMSRYSREQRKLLEGN